MGNRLTSVDGVAYQWDAKGNLLSDGESTFIYDHANRLSAVSGQPSAFSFAYNGLGDRLQQTVDGITTDYTLDLVAGLTQVLADGQATFSYGLGRIAQHGPAGAQYFLGDALASVRQLTDQARQLALAQAYEPFGDPLLAAGHDGTPYGYTGEWTDATGLVHLRARYYQPTVGRFFQPDPWSGNAWLPKTLNSYFYSGNNPINYLDPSGECYGPLEFLRKVPIEKGICTALDQALFIYAWPGSTANQRNLAAAYIGGWAFAHSALIVGIGGLAVAGGQAAVTWLYGLYIASPLSNAIGQACQQILNAWQTFKQSPPTSLWPAPWYGRQIINGIEYTKHALERMTPVGLGGRGIPPSVVENAIRYGIAFPGKDPGTMAWVYENVMVITDLAGRLVITLWKTGG